MNTRSMIAAYRNNPILRLTAALCGKFLRAYDNQNNWDMHTNGERFALARVTDVVPGTVFDVGANVGHYTQMCLALPNVKEVHAFELSPPTFEILSQNSAGLARVHLNRFGLGKGTETVQVYHAPGSDDRSGLYAVDDGYQREVFAAELRSGDDYLREAKVQHVSFLKIDVEGADFDVLRGFSGALAEGRVSAIQFEHGEPSIESRTFLHDIVGFLQGHGFLIFRLFPASFERIERYTYTMEDFRGRNYLALMPSVATHFGY